MSVVVLVRVDNDTDTARYVEHTRPGPLGWLRTLVDGAGGASVVSDRGRVRERERKHTMLEAVVSLAVGSRERRQGSQTQTCAMLRESVAAWLYLLILLAHCSYQSIS